MLLIKNVQLWRWRRPHRHHCCLSQEGAAAASKDDGSIMPEGGLVKGWMLVDEARGVFADVGYDDEEGGDDADRVGGFSLVRLDPTPFFT